MEFVVWLLLEALFWMLYALVRILFWPAAILTLLVVMTPVFLVASLFRREPFSVALATQYHELIQGCIWRARRTS